MSPTNEELIRRSFELWNAGDMERLRDLYDPDATMAALENWPEQGPFEGRAAVFRQFEQLRGTFHEDRLELLADPIASGEAAVARCLWTGLGDGPPAEMELAIAYAIRNGLITRVEFFWEHRQALAAAGLGDDDEAR